MHRKTGTDIQAETHAKAETRVQTARKGFSIRRYIRTALGSPV